MNNIVYQINELFSFHQKKQKKPSKDVLFRIGFAMGFNYKDINTLLMTTGFKDIYHRNPMDIVLMASLERDSSLEYANDYLADNGLPLLEK